MERLRIRSATLLCSQPRVVHGSRPAARSASHGIAVPCGHSALGPRATETYALEAFGFMAGGTALAGWGVLLRRHFDKPVGTAASQVADAVLLSQLFTLLTSGLGMAMIYRWASS